MMLSANNTVAEISLPQLDARGLLRRAALPALLAVGAVAFVLLAGGRANGFLNAIQRDLSVSPAWAGIAAAFELASLAGYVALLALVAGQATPRIGSRESAQITLAGAAATRLLPTAGAGGIGLALWSLRRAGLAPRAAMRTLIVFMSILYAVFLAAIVLSGGALALGLAHAEGPSELAAVPALIALLAIAGSLAIASGAHAIADDSRVGRGIRLFADAVREAWQLIQRRDARLLGAVAYWAFDAAVLWAMLHAFGASPAMPVVALAYFVGQVANTLPVPGSVSGGMTGVLIAFGMPAEVALPAVLAYRAAAVWLPAPIAIASVPALRATIARWGREDGRAASPLRNVPPPGVEPGLMAREADRALTVLPPPGRIDHVAQFARPANPAQTIAAGALSPRARRSRGPVAAEYA
jgi:uncharacterized membrane protein YbhN (UPF0104 family)